MKPTYSLQQIVHIVEEGFREVFFEFQFWVSAEIGKIKKHKSRYYLDLIQYNTRWEVVAKARGIIWDQHIVADFVHHTQLNLDDLIGKTLMMSAKCNFHHQWGFSLSIDEISSEFTLWEAKKQQQTIRSSLQTAGIYTHNKEKQLWVPPIRIAVISGRTSEWLKDFVSVCDESDYDISLDIYPSAVHGNAAKQEVPLAFGKIADKIQTAKIPYTAIALLRWWGWWDGIVRQNDLHIAQAICNSSVPVLLAIWHTTDKSILDEIVYHSSKTPTDAAYMLISYLDQRSETIDELYADIQDIGTSRLSSYTQLINWLYDDIQSLTHTRITQIQSDIQLRYTSISSHDPASILQHGYALLTDVDWEFLSSDQITSLQLDDEFVVKTATKELKVKVVGWEKRIKN